MTQRFVLASTLIILGMGCGSVETNSGSTTVPTGDDPFRIENAGATGDFSLDRDDACARYVAALEAKATALNCVLANAPSCPTAIDDLERRVGTFGQCTKYDKGTVDNCGQRIATFQACGDFATKSCAFLMRGEETPGCSRGGASSDAGTDASSTDAATDGASTDAGDAASGETSPNPSTPTDAAPNG